MYYSNRFRPKGRDDITQAPRRFSYGDIYFKDPGTDVEFILSSDGVIRDKENNVMTYDSAGKIHKK